MKSMKDYNIRKKLTVSFGIVIALAIFIAFVGIVGMFQISRADKTMYGENLLGVYEMGRVKDNYAQQRVNIRNLIIFDSGSDTFKNAVSGLSTLEQDMEVYFKAYEETITDEAERANFEDFKNTYRKDFGQVKKDVIDAGTRNDVEASLEVLIQGNDLGAKLNKLLSNSMESNIKASEKKVGNNSVLFMIMAVVEIIVLVVAVVIALYLAALISGLISLPTALVSRLMNDLVKTGDFRISSQDEQAIDEYSKNKDEVGQTAKAFSELLDMIVAKCKTLEAVAGGDLTAEIIHRSSQDTIGEALQKMVDNLNDMFSEINISSDQVSTGSDQVSSGSQLLAQGATEQASSVEELAATINVISENVRSNATNAKEASKQADVLGTTLQESNERMKEMTSSMAEISQTSGEIGKIIKLIEDIAFQTNILALNAAVEAARAGDAGKGFAVVASEVRSLAAKSAEAASSTTALIENSIKAVDKGTSIADDTANRLNAVVADTRNVIETINMISKASDEQASSISQVTEGVDQISRVVQTNSATAEQSAAASEELSSQATVLKSLVSRFKIKNASQASNSYHSSASSKNFSNNNRSAEIDLQMPTYSGGNKY